MTHITKGKLIVALLLIDFIALGTWAMSSMELWAGVRSVFETPYNIATFGDLIFGLALMGILVFYLEKNWKTALPWALSFFLLGNIGPALYLLFNLQKLERA